MKAGNAGTFLKMLNPNDVQYGFKKLSQGDVDKLIQHYKRGFLKGISNREEAKNLLWGRIYKENRKDVYGEDLIKSGVLEVPGPLKGLSVGKIREKLQKHKTYSYKFKVSYESSYKNAIKVLQQSLNISVTGRYTEDVARAVYEKVKGEIPKKKGYLASEDDPDRLFKSGFLEYVFCVDKYVWGLCGIEEKFLADDGGTVWKKHGPDASTDSDAQCRKVLADMDTFGSSYVVNGGVNGRVGEIFRDAFIEARDMLDNLFYDVRRTISLVTNSSPYDHSYLKWKYGLFARDKTWAYNVDKSFREDTFLFIDMLDFGLGMAQAENAEYAGSLIAFGLATLESGVGIIPLLIGGAGLLGNAALEIADPAPGMTDMLEQIYKPIDPTPALSAQLKYRIVESSNWKYLIQDTPAFNVRNQFIFVVREKLEEIMSSPFVYSSSPVETELYNRVIQKYLQTVIVMNENEDILGDALLKLLPLS